MSKRSSLALVAVLFVLDILFIRWVLGSGGSPAPTLLFGVVLFMSSAASAWGLVRFISGSAAGRLIFRVRTATRPMGGEVSGTIDVSGRRVLGALESDAAALTVALVASIETGSGWSERWRENQHPVGPLAVDARTQAFAFAFDLPDSLDAAIGHEVRWALVGEVTAPGLELRTEQALRVADTQPPDLSPGATGS